MSKTKTIAVFGVGPGMGRAVAHRFGREGFQVALVARNQTRPTPSPRSWPRRYLWTILVGIRTAFPQLRARL